MTEANRKIKEFSLNKADLVCRGIISIFQATLCTQMEFVNWKYGPILSYYRQLNIGKQLLVQY